MTARVSTDNLPLPRLCGWAMNYALRRWMPLLAVVASLLLRVGLDVLKPWPTVFLIDYLDHLLHGKRMSPVLENIIELLPGAATPQNLIGWSVAATILIFVLSWVIGLLAA